jgi:hypothetical protein
MDANTATRFNADATAVTGVIQHPMSMVFEHGQSDTALEIDRIPAKWQMRVITICLAYSTGITTYLSGIVTIATPAIASDLRLSPGLTLW